MLRSLGITRFSFIDAWRGLDLVPYEWRRIAEDTTASELSGQFPICQIVSQSIEDHSSGDAVYTLLQAREMAGPEALLVYIFDTDRFARRKDLQVRPFIDEHDLPLPRDYQQLVHSYLAMRPAGSLAPLLSFNTAWQGLAAGCKPGVSPRRLEDILDPRNHRSNSPIWDLYEHLCDVAGPEADADEVKRVLRHWIDRDVTRTLGRVTLALQRFGYDRAQVRRYRDEQQ
jgi:hypothetical protein